MLPESNFVGWGAMLRRVLARGYELRGWKCLCRGQGLSFPLPPPCPGRPPLDQNLSPPTLAAGWDPCTEPDPGLTVWGRGAPSWARPGASGAFLIISAWVTWGLL